MNIFIMLLSVCRVLGPQTLTASSLVLSQKNTFNMNKLPFHNNSFFTRIILIVYFLCLLLLNNAVNNENSNPNFR